MESYRLSFTVHIGREVDMICMTGQILDAFNFIFFSSNWNKVERKIIFDVDT